MKQARRYDYRKLAGRIKEICGTQDNFADEMGMDRSTINQKLNNKSPFKQPEIDKACDILHIEALEIPVYFFTPDDVKSQH